MRAYEEYKKIDLPWLEEIPAHWKVQRAKNLFKVINERSEEGKEELLSVSSNHGVVKRNDTNVTMFQAESYEGYKLCWPEDLVINSLWAWQNGLGFSKFYGIVSTAYSVYRLNTPSDNYRFFDYLLRSSAFHWELRTRSKGIWKSRYILSDEDFLNSPIICPPREEQDAIVRFLDAKCAKIDRLIKLKERQIELLNEKKQNIINQAVTKGLDPHAPMKDSGVDWIGEIPEGWEVKRLLTFATFQNGISEAGEFFTSGSPFVTYGDVYNNYELPTEAGGVAKSNSKQQEVYSVKRGDIFLTRTSETIEEIGFSSVCMKDIEQAVFSGFLIRVRPQEGIILPEYSKYFFRSTAIREYFSSAMNIVIRASLGQTLLKNLPVILPPLDQQKKIAIHLEISSEKITRSIQFVESNIFLLKEYKQKLISDVVTGKCNVGNN